MDQERNKSSDCGPEKFMQYQKKQYDGTQRLCRPDRGDYSEISDPSTASSPVLGASANCFEENDMLVAGGIAAQVKRFGSIAKPSNSRQYVEFLINRINELEDSLNNRDLIVNTLQRELELSKDNSVIDASAGPITCSSSDADNKLLERNSHGSPFKMEEKLILKLQEKDREIEKLHHELLNISQMNGDDNLKSKIVVLESLVKDHAITIDQLNTELLQKKKLLQMKTDEFVKQTGKASNDIRALMRKVEEMGRELQNKDIDLRQTRDELVRVRADMEENFGTHLSCIKEQLKMCHTEEKDRLNSIHDDMMMRYMKAHETEIACYKKQIDSLKHRIKELSESDCELDKELAACRLAHDAQINSYKECVESLMDEISVEKEKSESQHKTQVEKYKLEMENYKRQISNLELRLSEEVHKVEDKYSKQLDKYRKECEAQFSVYKCCAESLKKKEKLVEEDIASVNAHLENAAKVECNLNKQCAEFKKEIEQLKNEIEKLNSSLKEAENNKANTLEMYYTCKKDLEEQTEKHNILQEKLKNKESNEEMLMNELKKYQGVIDDYEKKVNEYNRKFQDDLSQVESKHATVVNTFQEQIDNLISTLEEAKQQYNVCRQQCSKQQQQIESVEMAAECNIEEVGDKIKMHKSCKEEINSLTVQLNIASTSLREYESQLSQMQKCYDDELSLYKSQVDKLKDELNHASSLEVKLARQLSNHVHGVKESKDHLKELLLQKDMQLYLLGNSKGLDLQRFGDGSAEKVNDTDIQSYHLKSEIGMSDGEEPRFEDVDNLGKPKCNISIQPSPSNSLEKRLVEQALLNELQKELEDCKIENSKKEDLMKKFIKANNELAEHCKTIEIQFNELKNYTDEKIEEVESLRNEKESLLHLKHQLESDQLFLISKIESLSEELSNKNAEVESLPEHMDYNVDSAERHPFLNNVRRLFKNVATSTPNIVEEVNKQGGEEDALTPKRRMCENQGQPQNTLGKWINRCNILENENVGLRKDINLLTLKVKEMEYCSEVVKKEIVVFQENCQDLENRLVALETEKKLVFELERLNEQLSIRNEKLEEARHILRNDVANLKKENINLERQFNDTRTKLFTEKDNNEQIGSEALESLVMELNQKSEEILILKEELNSKQSTIITLESELDKLVEIRVGLKSKLDIVLEDLKKSEEELATLRQERMNIGLEKRILEKKLVVVRSQNEQLMSEFGERTQSVAGSNVFSVVVELEKELLDLHKKLAAEKGVIERMSIEKSVAKEGSDISDDGTTEKLSLFKELENEKEMLKMKTNELQQIIDKYMDNNEIDENWQLIVRESQQKLLMELEDYSKRNEHFEGTLLETEELKCRVHRMERSLLTMSKEKCEVEELLVEERQSLHNAVNKMRYLELQLCEKIDVLQAVGAEKEQLQNNLWSLQEKLCCMEERLHQQKLLLEGEIQERDFRVRHAQLELQACQLDAHSMQNGPNFNTEHESEVEMVARMQKEIEKEHNMAISRLKRLYFNQMQGSVETSAAELVAIEQRHQSQVTFPCIMETGSVCMQN